MRDAHEQCPSCLQLYVYELEVRCVHCDGPACQFCAVRVAGVWICAPCNRPGGDMEERNDYSRNVES
jgi:hypothetical protein